LLFFTRQLPILLDSGVPLIRALDVLGNESEDPAMWTIVTDVNASVQSGMRLSEALQLFPGVFSPTYVCIVRLGEESGKMADCLSRLAGWMERDREASNKVVAALIYPGFVAILSLALGLALFGWVLPPLFDVLRGLHVSLPLFTRILFAISSTLQNPLGLLFALMTLGSLASMGYQNRQDPRVWKVLRRAPAVGRLLCYSGLSRYCVALQTLLDQGGDLIMALKIAALASGDPYIIDDSPALVEHVISGETVSNHMKRNPKIYPSALVQYTRVGEEMADMARMMERAADIFEGELNHAIEIFGAAIEPLMLMMVGGTVGAIVIAVFVPLYSYLQTLG